MMRHDVQRQGAAAVVVGVVAYFVASQEICRVRGALQQL